MHIALSVSHHVAWVITWRGASRGVGRHVAEVGSPSLVGRMVAGVWQCALVALARGLRLSVAMPSSQERRPQRRGVAVVEAGGSGGERGGRSGEGRFWRKRRPWRRRAVLAERGDPSRDRPSGAVAKPAEWAADACPLNACPVDACLVRCVPGGCLPGGCLRSLGWVRDLGWVCGLGWVCSVGWVSALGGWMSAQVGRLCSVGWVRRLGWVCGGGTGGMGERGEGASAGSRWHPEGRPMVSLPASDG